MTHGIFGAGSNWRGIARKLVDRRREWGVVLVDLRLHGKSDAGTPPHTLGACADDLASLIRELGDVHALAGHSFGGKTALATRSRVELAQTWVLDATPGARPEAIDDPDNSSLASSANPSVVRVLDMMARMPPTWPTRDAFVAAVTAEGHGVALAQWLAMNLVAQGDAMVNRLDVAALRSLLVDYYAVDLWAGIGDDLHFVIATTGSSVPAADRDRLRTTPAHVHEVTAGHWLHIDAPAAVVELFATHLP